MEGRDADDELARLARALAHPTRVAILRAIRRAGAVRIHDLVTQLGAAQSTVSEHVRVLREAGVIQTGERTGEYVPAVHVLRRLKALAGSL